MLRSIYMVRFCRMQPPYDSLKADLHGTILQPPYDMLTTRKKVVGF